MKKAAVLFVLAAAVFGAGWFFGPVLDGSFSNARAIVAECNHVFASTDYQMSPSEKVKCQAAREDLRRETLAKLDSL